MVSVLGTQITELCKNGWTDHDAVWAGVEYNQPKRWWVYSRGGWNQYVMGRQGRINQATWLFGQVRHLVGWWHQSTGAPCSPGAKSSIPNCLVFCLYRTSVVCRLVRSTLRQSRPNKAGLKCSSVCTSVRPQRVFEFDFNEIWHVGRGRWVMHDGMQYDPIQGHGQGHEPFKFENPAIFNSYLLRHLQWELATDYGFLKYREQYLLGPDF